MTHRRTMTVADDLVTAIDTVLDIAVTNVCSCDGGGESNGYLGHRRDCHVHQYRKWLRTVDDFVKHARLNVEDRR